MKNCNFRVKRVLDFILSFVLLIVFLPVLLVIGLAVWFVMGRPIMFCQERPGYKGKIFKIYKFRTMRAASDKNKDVSLDAKRLTPLGIFLRRMSLDELPELFNVLKGDMSLVGPRPLLPQYLNRYSREQARRHDVKPGITGWAQVNGRNAISWEEKFKFDVWYVDNCSFWLDMKIIFLTVGKIFAREGINQPGQATAEEFRPNRQTGG